MKKNPTVGRAEGEVLRFIAESGGASVTEVGDHLAATKGQTRNTAFNMMERLRKKGFLNRKRVDGIYRYFSSQEKGSLFQHFVHDFVEGVLNGSIEPLVAYLGKRATLDDDQMQELRKLVTELEDTRHEP